MITCGAVPAPLLAHIGVSQLGLITTSQCPVPKIVDYAGMRQELAAVFAVGWGAAAG